jgi:hypothetical protein
LIDLHKLLSRDLSIPRFLKSPNYRKIIQTFEKIIKPPKIMIKSQRKVIKPSEILMECQDTMEE